MKILVADDSRTMRKVFRNILESFGHAPTDIFEASDCVEALSILKSRQYDADLVIADLDMPGMENHAFLRRLKSESPNRKIPVLLVINASQQAYAQEAIKAGAVDALSRPFRDADLKGKLQQFEGVVQDKKSREASTFLRAIVSTAEVEADLPFLMQLPSHLMKEFLQLSTRATFESGAVVYKPGDTVDSLYVVTIGQVEILNAEGKKTEVAHEGETFGELAFMSSEKAAHTARATTWCQVVTLPRVKLAELLRHQPRMGQYLSALVARRAKALNKPNIRSDSELAGNLSSMSFSDVLQLLQLGRKTGLLELFQDKRKGQIRVESGEVRHALTADKIGEDAFYDMAGWKTATFSFASGAAGGTRSIAIPTLSLLMETMRRLDETERSAASSNANLQALFGESAQSG